MPQRHIPLRTAADYALRAFTQGRDSCSLAGDCLAPVHQVLRGVEELAAGLRRALADSDVDKYEWDGREFYVPGHEPGTARPKVISVVIAYRCRKCQKCLAQKRRQWTARAIAEVRQSTRTWFGTLTVRPSERFRAQVRADIAARQRWAERLSALSDKDRLKFISRVLGPEVTRFMKRVRFESKASLRYLLVVEPHKDGFPHYHLLLHETGPVQVSKRVLERQWGLGVSHWRLVDREDPRQAGYVCKYVNKSAEVRIRASRHYGQFRPEVLSEVAGHFAAGLPMQETNACQRKPNQKQG